MKRLVTEALMKRASEAFPTMDAVLRATESNGCVRCGNNKPYCKECRGGGE